MLKNKFKNEVTLANFMVNQAKTELEHNYVKTTKNLKKVVKPLGKRVRDIRHVMCFCNPLH